MKISNEVKIGILGVAALALLFFGYNFMKGQDIFNPDNTYYARYDAVDGLAVSNFVKIKGLNVGRVTKFFLERKKNGKVLVQFTVKDDIKIPKGSIARIVSADLLGTKAVDLQLDTTKIFYADGDTLMSDVQESLTQSVQAEILPVKEKAENLLASIDSVLTIIKSVFNEQTTDDIKKSVSSITETLNHINHSAESVEGLLDKNTTRIDRIFANIESISLMLKDNEQNISAVLSNLNNITDTLAKSNLRQAIANAQDVLEHTADILDKINKGQGSAGMLINDDKLYNNLEATTKDLDLLMQDMKANPSRYVHFSIFGGGRSKTEKPTSAGDQKQ